MDKDRLVSLPSGNNSTLGRLLEEISWEVRSVRRYRSGGRGLENILTAEVLMPLDFLPRRAFLGAVIEAAHGADDARLVVASQIEAASISLLPEQVDLSPTLGVQPDGFISTPDALVLVEAKRIKPNRFQTEQLAREFVTVHRAAAGRSPLLLLILGQEPPVRVGSIGYLTVSEAIQRYLDSVLGRTLDHTLVLDDLRHAIPDSVAWITWQEVAVSIQRAAAAFEVPDPSTSAAISRLSSDALRAIAWHS